MEQHLLTCDRCGKTEKHGTTSPPSSGLALATPPLPGRAELHVNFCGECVEAFSEFAPSLDRSCQRGLGAYTTHPHVVVLDVGVAMLPTQSAQITERMINLPFWPERFEFLVQDLDAWTVHDFSIGNRSQVRYRPAILSRDLSIPLALLTDPDHVNELMHSYETCKPGMSMALTVTYIGKIHDGEKFLCHLHGRRGGFARLADVEERGTERAVEVDQALKRWNAIVIEATRPQHDSPKVNEPQLSTAS